MSETARTTEKKKTWLLGRVIRATAFATAEALYERLQRDNEAEIPSGTPREHGADIANDGANTLHAAEIEHLLRIYDGLSQLLDHYESRGGLSKRRKRRLRPEIRLVTTVTERVLTRLKALGVTPMPFPDRVDYRCHEPVRVVTTLFREDDGRVVDVYIPGFVNGERVVRHARVSVLKYVPKPEPTLDKENSI